MESSKSQANKGPLSSYARGQDPKTAPSKESGGIPEPSTEYLDVSKLESERQDAPGPLLVVVDLNGTLLHRQYPHEYTLRPGAREFVGHCLDSFTLVIWSSASPRNVEKMCQLLFSPEQLRRVAAVWGRDSFGLSEGDYMFNPQVYKRLGLLWDDGRVQASHPRHLDGGSDEWDQRNTVLVDDSAEKARSEPYNLVEVPKFAGDLKRIGEDTVLSRVSGYLDELRFQTNVSAYMRSHPFKADSRSP